MNFSLPIPRDFSLWSTVYSHGWCALPPFSVDKKQKRLRIVVPGKLNTHYAVSLCEGKKGLAFSVENTPQLTAEAKSEIERAIFAILRVDESLQEFYVQAKKYPRYRWISRRKAGRLLRCPTVFEDVVKMICTTNCSWALTEIMVGALTTKLGTHIDDTVYSFPTPAAIAAQSESFLRREIRCGYRAPYLLELSQRIESGSLAVEAWRTSDATTEELFKQVLSVKGVGEYAAGNILKLLGRYDYLGLDSWCRGKFYEIYKNGRKVKDSTIEKHYAQFGRWRGLFLWMDVTKDWYEKEFPF
jgi:N-glycosylase/DNA lyase